MRIVDERLWMAWTRATGAEAMPDNPFRLDGKPAIVVGAALGIGRAIALAFAEAGAKVACLDIDEAAAGETAARIKGSTGTAMAQIGRAHV